MTQASLVRDADSEVVLGFADEQLWYHREDKAHSTPINYKQQPI